MDFDSDMRTVCQHSDGVSAKGGQQLQFETSASLKLHNRSPNIVEMLARSATFARFKRMSSGSK